MNYELGIPADIRGKLGFPLDGLSGRASSEETAASARTSLSERSELGCDSERRSRSSPSASALTFWLLLGQAKSDTSDLIRRLRIGTAPFLYRRPEYRHLEQRSLLAQQRVASCPVQYGIGRRESRHDSPYMRSLDLGGGRYPFSVTKRL